MNDEFYDRYKETKLLKEKHDNLNRGEFGVVYGRRRMGKTQLLLKFLEKIHSKNMYVNVTDNSPRNFMDTLSGKIEKCFGEVVKISKWHDFFRYISAKSTDRKLVIVIDEFQRLNKFARDFIYNLQDYWDRELKFRKIMLIICGSSMSMMHKLALEEKGPLYGRATFQFPVKQFRYVDLREMFKELTEIEKIQTFAVFGGTPKYLTDFKNTKSTLFQVIQPLILSKNSILFDEPLNALKLELNSPERYSSILQAISKGKVESKEIADFIGIDNNELSPYLKNLEELLDLITSDDPLFGKRRMKRYALKDNFYKFWYRFVSENREHIEIGNTSFILDKIKKEFDNYCGKIFESVVKEFFVYLNGRKIMGKKVDFQECGKWWNESEEIDLILKCKNETIFIECKFKEKQQGVECYEELKRKSKLTEASGKFSYVLVSKSGFDQNIKDKKIEDLLLIDLEDMSKILSDEVKQDIDVQGKLNDFEWS